jgi:small subunit ribosomal protein S18
MADDRKRKGRRVRRRKICPFTADPTLVIDYKDPKLLRRFISERGRIVPRRISGVSSKHQRALGQAIKRARTLGLVPFTTINY